MSCFLQEVGLPQSLNGKENDAARCFNSLNSVGHSVSSKENNFSARKSFHISLQNASDISMGVCRRGKKGRPLPGKTEKLWIKKKCYEVFVRSTRTFVSSPRVLSPSAKKLSFRLKHIKSKNRHNSIRLRGHDYAEKRIPLTSTSIEERYSHQIQGHSGTSWILGKLGKHKIHCFEDLLI